MGRIALDIVVIICSHRRAADLSRCLRSIAAAEGRHRVSVLACVNETSAADYRQVVDACQAADPAATFLHVPTLGLSHARNAGLAAARGADWAVFLDDDVTVPADWPVTLSNALAAAGSNIGVVTGRVLPAWEGRAVHSPQWRMLLSLVEDTRGVTGAVVPGVGAFFCVRPGIGPALQGFDGGLGRSGRNLLGAEESLLFHRVADRGMALRFDPSTEVLHHIPRGRCSWRWLVRRAYWEGVTQHYLQTRHGQAPRPLATALSWPKSVAKGLLFLATLRIDFLVAALWHVGFAVSGPRGPQAAPGLAGGIGQSVDLRTP
ncbi:MAG TPA: glycosyltransferase [Roseomonas sp.]